MTERFHVVPASWAAAAGHVEAGESAVQAAVREAREELGILVAADDVVPLTAMHRTNGDGHAISERDALERLRSGVPPIVAFGFEYA